MQDYSKLRLILPAFIASRVLVLCLIIFTQQVQIEKIPAKEGFNYKPELLLDIHKIPENLKLVFSSADADWYFKIAEVGYDNELFTKTTPKNWVFFPLFPLLIKLLNLITHSSIASSLLISHFCFLLSLYFLASFLGELSFSDTEITRASFLLCFFPVSYFFSAPLTEPLFFLLLIASWYFLELRKTTTSILLYSLLLITRPTGVIILPAYIFRLQQKGLLNIKNIIPFGAILVLPLSCFLFYLYKLTGNFLAFSQNQLAWNRGLISFSELLSQTYHNPNILMISWNFILLNISLTLAAFMLAIYHLTKKRYDFFLLIFLPLSISLSTGSYVSLARFCMVSFPIYLALVEIFRSEKYFYLLLSIFTAIFAVMTLLYSSLYTSAMA
ncbi:MAG: hypothetical protein KBD63_08070 [Bacteriovoracaceae bacterium]|nr:hypothetical protein [Bacteriovoracaceae bacterium]